MSERETRTERSYCRICTSMCGILVDIEGEKVVRVRGDRDHPVTRGYMCPKGSALPRMHHDPRRLEHPLLRTGRCSPANVLGALSGRPQHAPARHHRPARSCIGRHLLRQRRGYGCGRLSHGPGAARGAENAGAVQSLDHRWDCEVAGGDLGGRLHGLESAAGLRARQSGHLHRHQPDGLPRPHGRDAQPRQDDSRDGSAGRGVGDRSASHRDGALCFAAHGAAARHRLRDPGLSDPRAAAGRRRPGSTGAPYPGRRCAASGRCAL